MVLLWSCSANQYYIVEPPSFLTMYFIKITFIDDMDYNVTIYYNYYDKYEAFYVLESFAQSFQG